MQGSNSNGKNLVVIGLVLLVAILVMWLITDTFFTIGLFVSIGVMIGGLILTKRGRKVTT